MSKPSTDRPVVVCGAKLRTGGTCQRPPVPGRKRCGSHGGNVTEAGKAATAAGVRRRWEAYREAQAAAEQERQAEVQAGGAGQEPEQPRKRTRHRAPLTFEELQEEAIRLRALLARPAAEQGRKG